jgi:N-acetylmuramoyl-L-alanine amidase
MTARSVLCSVLLLLAGPDASSAAAGEPAVLSRIRHSSAADQTRIVLDLSAAAVFLERREADPPTVVVVFPDADVGDGVRGEPVADGAVEGIELRATEAGLEVIVALTAAVDCDVFPLDATADKPFRVVIDVPRATTAGAPRASAASEEAGAPGGGANARPPAGGSATGPSAPSGPAIAAPAASASAAPVYRVVIDPGHGGEDWGTRGYGGLVEKKLTLDIARRIARFVRASGSGWNATLTREDDSFVSLQRRVRMAQTAQADLFVSIHANSSPSPSARGVEVFFVSLSKATDQAAEELADKENAAHLIGVDSLAAANGAAASDDLLGILLDMRQSETIERSSSLAEEIIEAYRSDGQVPVRGVKQAGFQVLKSVVVPSVLVEVGFVTNSTEAKLLLKPEYRERLARAIASGIESFLTTETGMRATR